MLIKELYIEDYKVLKDLQMKFEDSFSVMIGKNGSGKSTVLEFIANIYYDLYTHFVLGKGDRPKFDFKLRYEVDYNNTTYEVYITANKKTKEYYEVNIKKEGSASQKYAKAKINQEFSRGYKDILPQNVVMYYSGISSILRNRFLKFQDSFIRGSLDGDLNIEQPFYYFLANNFPSILMGLLSYQYGDIPETLEKEFGISGFKEIKINIKKPYWAKPKAIPDDYWGAAGDLRVFLQKMDESCSRKDSGDSFVNFVFTSKDELENMWSFYGEEKSLFEYISTLQANDLIDKVDVILIKNNQEISLEGLSEGEKQVLTVFGLNELLSTGNTLFLLDEPDTYLHPAWQREFIQKIRPSDTDRMTNFIITTHSPQTLSNLREKEVLIMRDGKVYSVDANGLFGRDSNAILEEVMGTSDMSSQAQECIEKIDRAIALKKTDEAIAYIEELKGYLSLKDPFFVVAEMRVERLKRQ